MGRKDSNYQIVDRPVSLHDGICYIVQNTNVSANFMDFDEDFTLTWCCNESA